MPTTASFMFSAKASVATFMKLFRSVASELIPAPFRSYIYEALNYLFAPLFSGDLTLVVDELSGMTRNQVFDAAELYLRTKIGPHTERLRISKASRKKNNGDQEGEERQDFRRRYFELTFHKKHMDKVISSYLPYVIVQVDAIKAEEKVLKLYTRHIWSRYDDDDVANSKWGSVNLEHPSTFDTMAMEPEMKKMIVEDLERFVRRKEFYKKVGKAWKMGNLLYGPPGTQKSSLIAAMANYLKFNVHDLELTSIYSDSQLKKVLLSTTNRYILVIEDIDCCRVDVGNGGSDSDSDPDSDRSRVTLSGLLNFIDGLWSSCGD